MLTLLYTLLQHGEGGREGGGGGMFVQVVSQVYIDNRGDIDGCEVERVNKEKYFGLGENIYFGS